MIGTAILIMTVSSLAAHLGLSQAIARVVCKIMKCGQCLTFWTSLVVLTYTSGNIVMSGALSLFVAYLSNWLALVLSYINYIYDKIWRRIQRRRR